MNLINKHNPWAILIQESKLENLSPKLLKSIWNSPDLDFCLSPSEGNSGGLITVWDTHFFHMESSRIERHWIAIEGTLLRSQLHCTIVNIYNPCSVSLRAIVWQDITNYFTDQRSPGLFIGDYNEVLSHEDRGSMIIDPRGSHDFSSFIQNLQLIEISAIDGKFTWFRGSSKSKLDRLFVQADWITTYPSMQVSLLKRSISDHCPLLVTTQGIDWGPKPFRFQDCWLTHEGCLDIIKKAWRNSNNMAIMEKLRSVKYDLKTWNWSEFGNIDSNILRLENEIQGWDEASNSRMLLEDELKLRNEAQSDLWAWLRRKELYWAQHSRDQWLKSGDKNTRYFHTIASIRRRKNSLRSIKSKGKILSEPDEIKKEAVNFYTDLFKEDFQSRPTFENLGFKSLTEAQAQLLTAPFKHEEIDAVVDSCNPSKAPGPDGFNFKFIKAAWYTIKHDIYNAVQIFWSTGELPKGCNVAFIALIAKTECPEGFHDYRPISMVGSIYKIIAKILTLRLKQVMNDIIGPYQSAFIEGRQILDGALIAGELIETYKRKKEKAAILKLDFHKAFDCVSWKFLDWVQTQMGFPASWRRWISSCVNSASASILLNGTPTTPFNM